MIGRERQICTLRRTDRREAGAGRVAGDGGDRLGIGGKMRGMAGSGGGVAPPDASGCGAVRRGMRRCRGSTRRVAGDIRSSRPRKLSLYPDGAVLLQVEARVGRIGPLVVLGPREVGPGEVSPEEVGPLEAGPGEV